VLVRARVALVLPAALVLAVALLALGGGAAQGRVVFIHGRGYGMTLSPKARTSGRSLFHGRVQPLTVGGPQPPLTYHGGPLMLSSTLYLIFWGPQDSFPTSYTAPIIQYAKDLQADDLRTTDEFSVAEQYVNANNEPITGKLTLGGEDFDTAPYPTREEEGCTTANTPCVTDSEIQSEIRAQIDAKVWPTDPATAPEAQYLVYTPPGVTDCAEDECSNTVFCAYHSQITGLGSGSEVATYSDLPDAPVCDSGQAPPGVDGSKDADGTLDSEIHEIVESATDPEPESGYTDKNHEEAADKCTYETVTTEADIYGTPLGGSVTEFTAFNQLIDGHSYYTQQIWSNAPTATPAPAKAGEPAGCAARIGPTPSFTAPASGETGHAIAFDGSASYDISAKITTYEWSFGDGSPVDTTSGPTPTHTYLKPGEYQVSLTVIDSDGKTDASTQTLPITITGAAVGPPTATIEAPADNQTYVVGESVPTKFSCAEAAGGPGIESCTDANGSASPGRLDTSTAGSHSYTVTALSSDGQRGTATIDYNVSSPSGNPGGGNPGGSGNPGSGADNAGSSGGATGSASSTTTSSAGSTSGTGSSGAGGHVKPLSSVQKLARAIKACEKLEKSKRASCIAAAKRRFRPKKGKRKAKPATKQHSLGLGLEEGLRLVLVGGPFAQW
jgi:PKD repeat protein